MSDPYEELGVPADADDATIRRRYLELARAFTPEQHPVRFAAVRAAFEQIKDLDARARHRLLRAGEECTIESLIEEASCMSGRHRAGLRALTAAMDSTSTRS